MHLRREGNRLRIRTLFRRQRNIGKPACTVFLRSSRLFAREQWERKGLNAKNLDARDAGVRHRRIAKFSGSFYRQEGLRPHRSGDLQKPDASQAVAQEMGTTVG